MLFISKIFIPLLFFFSVQFCMAQVQQTSQQDTLRVIEILRAKNQRQITIDSATVVQTLAGNASVKQGNTILDGDSIILNQLSGVAEVFGNVHINDADSVHTYAQYLKYIGNDRIAYLKKNVKLTDGKAVLTTEDLVYNLATGIANYTNGGKVVNGSTVLTSEDATYYSDTKDVFFKKNVHLVDPKYNMRADSLRYNTEFKEAYFISPTHIISKDGIIDTRSGTYNLETGEAVFLDRSSFRDSIRFMSGDKTAYEEKTGIIQIEGHGKFVDSVNNVIVLGDQLLIDKTNSTFLATRKPVMILFKDNDSTYVAADTLFSGLRRFDSSANKPRTNDSIKRDTKIMSKIKPDTTTFNFTFSKDTLKNLLPASLNDSNNKKNVTLDSSLTILQKYPAPKIDSLKNDTSFAHMRSAFSALKKNDTAQVINSVDTLNKPTVINIDSIPKDSIRYFLGFHNVRIYNDSLQAVSDSMYYSTEDSTFKLFGKPVCWNNQTQIKGDTMHLYTENQKAKRMYVFFNSIVINKTKEGFYNQMGGRTINGYFKEGNIDYIRVKGSPAESIFYPQDDDSAYVGMNRSKGDAIDIFFINKELHKIKFINDVDGTLFPLRQIPPDQKFLKNFIWEDKRRPKNKLELFE